MFEKTEIILKTSTFIFQQQASSCTNAQTKQFAQQLVNLNNNGQIYLSWYVLEDVLYGTNTGGHASPLVTVLTAAAGLQVQLYKSTTSEYKCASLDMLRHTYTSATQFYTSTSQPLYVMSIVGSPKYKNNGRNQHSAVAGIDLQCGSAVYGSLSSGTCSSIVGFCSRGPFPSTTLIAHENGCGENWWPISLAHCSELV